MSFAAFPITYIAILIIKELFHPNEDGNIISIPRYLQRTIRLFLSASCGYFLWWHAFPLPILDTEINLFPIVGIIHFLYLVPPMVQHIRHTDTDSWFLGEMQDREHQVLAYFFLPIYGWFTNWIAESLFLRHLSIRESMLLGYAIVLLYHALIDFQMLQLYFMPALFQHVGRSETDCWHLAELQQRESEALIWFGERFFCWVICNYIQSQLPFGAYFNPVVSTLLSAFVTPRIIRNALTKLRAKSVFSTLTPLLSVRGLFMLVHEALCFRTFHKQLAQSREHRKAHKDPRPRYQYQDLESKRHIRLLRLTAKQPGKDQCYELIPVGLDETPAYEALSYTWGEKRPSIPLQVDSGEILVTQAVEEFLLFQSSTARSQLFWIDAICIDQAANIEKASQVPLMTEIYQRAKRVIIWLGPPETSTQSKLIRDSIYPCIWAKTAGIPVETFFSASESTRLSANLDHFISDLLSHPWFQRAWIVQEAAVARTTHIFYKGLCIELDHLTLAIEAVLESPRRLLGLAQTPKSVATKEDTNDEKLSMAHKTPEWLENGMKTYVKHLRTVRKAVQSNKKIPLIGLILETRYFQCRDPRDKVFSLIGLLGHAGNHLPFKPSYSDSVESVFLRTVRHVLCEADWFAGLLVSCGSGYEPDAQSEPRGHLPSWVLDIERRQSLSPWVMSTRSWHLRDTTAKVMFTINLKEIGLQCFTIDTIQHLGSRFRVQGSVPHVRPRKAPESAEEYLERCNQSLQLISEELKTWYLNNRELARSHSRASQQSMEESDQDFFETCIMVGNSRLNFQPIHGIQFTSQKNRVIFERLLVGDMNGLRQAFAKKELDLHDALELFQATLVLFGSIGGLRHGGLSFCITSEGRMVLAPPLTQSGDMIVHVKGGWNPLVFRRTSNNEKRAELVGSCYVHGLEDVYSGSEWEEWWLE